MLAKSLSGGLWKLISSNSGACSPNRSQEVSGGSFETILGLARQIDLRRFLEVHFEQFWGLLAKSISGGSGGSFQAILGLAREIALRRLWGFISSNSRACSPNRSQEVFGGSFSAILELARRVGFRRLWTLISSNSGACSPNRRQEVFQKCSEKVAVETGGTPYIATHIRYVKVHRGNT